MTTYAIQFDYPEGTVYAGLYKGAYGWAPTLRTALTFPSKKEALATLETAYGQSSQEYGRVVRVEDDDQPPTQGLASLLP